MASLALLPEEVRQIIYYYVLRTPMWEQHLDKCKQRQGSDINQRRCCRMCFAMGDDRRKCFLQPCVIELQNNYFTLQRQIFWYELTSYARSEPRYQRCSLPMVCRSLNPGANGFLYKHTPIFINIKRDTRACPLCDAFLDWNTSLEPKKFTSLDKMPLCGLIANLWVTIDIKHDRDSVYIASIICELEAAAESVRTHPDPAFDPPVFCCMVCGRGGVEEVAGSLSWRRYSTHRGQLKFLFKASVERDRLRRARVIGLLDELAESIKF